MASPQRIREIIEFVTTDADTEVEVMAGWGVALEDTRPAAPSRLRRSAEPWLSLDDPTKRA